MPKTARSPAPTARKPITPKSTLTHEEIALRAYQIYLERGGAPGNELEDWARAERELLEKSDKPGRKPGPKLVAA